MNKALKIIGYAIAFCLGIVVLFATSSHWSEHTKQYDGFKIIDHRKHYALDIHDGGLGRLIDRTLCLDSMPLCFRAETVWANYPNDFPKARWIQICDPKTDRWRFFSRASAVELACLNCDAEALRCPKISESAGAWFSGGDKVNEIVGYPSLNKSTLRSYSFSNAGVSMKDITSIGVAFNPEYISARVRFNNGTAYAWLQCVQLNCALYWVDFESGKWFFENTPCNSEDELTLEIVDNVPQLRTEWDARGDEICLNASGKPAYPSVQETKRLNVQPGDEAKRP